MTACVLDASVAAKWFLPGARETRREEAAQVLEAYAAGRLQLLVPDLFWPEVGNIFWKAARQGRISRQGALESILALEERRISTAPTAPLVGDAFLIASAFDRSVYDGIYVALAVLENVPLLTADEKLVNALATRFPVRWLGAM